MVDLVKIRKKAKKQMADGGRQMAEEKPPVQEPEPEAVPESKAEAIASPAPEPQAPNPSAAQSKLEKFKQEAGKRRTLQAETETLNPQLSTVDTLELLTFVIAGEQYAVDIERIVEIVTPRPLTRIPNADASVVGIISLRGTIVTLVDVRKKLRHPPMREETADTRIVVVDYRSEMVGFLVDRVLRVVKAAAAEIEPHPVVHATELEESIRGVFRASGALTILLDLDKLLDSRALAASTA